MKNVRIAASLAASMLLLSAAGTAAAQADIVAVGEVNNAFEGMTLQYDDAHSIAGPDGHTRLFITVENRPQDRFDGCNLRPGQKVLSVDWHASTAGVARVSFPQGASFASCDDTVPVDVTPLHSGTTTITFTGTTGRGENAAPNDFKFNTARFTVNVLNVNLGTTDGTVKRCDADPAAPAWASAILKASGLKPGSAKARGAIRAVARAMEPRAEFADVARDGQRIAKSFDPDYADAVRNFLVKRLEDVNLASVDDARRPGWVCRTT